MLTACDNGPSAVAGKQADGAQTAGAQAGAAPSTDRAAAGAVDHRDDPVIDGRSEEHTSELQSLVTISYAVFCLDRKSVV